MYFCLTDTTACAACWVPTNLTAPLLSLEKDGLVLEPRSKLFIRSAMVGNGAARAHVPSNEGVAEAETEKIHRCGRGEAVRQFERHGAECGPIGNETKRDAAFRFGLI